jgi:hypothetical protein
MRDCQIEAITASKNPLPKTARAPSSTWPPARARPTPPARSPTGSSSTPAPAASSFWSTAPTSAPGPRRVPAVRHARHRPQVHRALQRPAPHLAARRRLPRHHLHHPAPLLDPARRGTRRGARRSLRRRTRRRPGQHPHPRCRLQPAIPIEKFDFIVTDECHRSIYNLWRQVLEYFDAFLIGLTATPAPQTIGFFNQNLVMEYNHERAVADGVNVGYDVYRIKTRVTEQGGKVEKRVSRRPPQQGRPAPSAGNVLDDDLDYDAARISTAPSSCPTRSAPSCSTFKDACSPSSFPAARSCPRPSSSPRTIPTPRTSSTSCREVFGKGNDFCQEDHLPGQAPRHRQAREVRRRSSGVPHSRPRSASPSPWT